MLRSATAKQRTVRLGKGGAKRRKAEHCGATAKPNRALNSNENIHPITQHYDF